MCDLRLRIAELELQAATERLALFKTFLEIIEQELPIWDGSGMDPVEHHCEWTLLNERHRARTAILARLRDE